MGLSSFVFKLLLLINAVTFFYVLRKHNIHLIIPKDVISIPFHSFLI